MPLELNPNPDAIAEIVHQPSVVYHSDHTRLSRSQLATFIESRTTFHRQCIVGDAYWQQAETADMKFGTLFHSLVLDRMDFNKTFVLIPRDVLNEDGHKRGKAYIQFKNDPSNAGRVQMVEAELVEYREMWNAVRSNATAAELLFNGDAAENEITIHWRDYHSGLPFRARIDRVRPGHCIVDLKTINQATPRAIEAAISDRMYYLQAALYRDAWAQFTGQRGDRQDLPFVLVFVGKSKPFDVVSVQLSEKWLERGRRLAERAVLELSDCLHSGDFSNPLGEGILMMDPPAYTTTNWGPMPWAKKRQTH